MSDRPVVDTELGPLPDMAALHPLGEHPYASCGTPEDCGQCDECCALTPRNALLVYLAAEAVTGELQDLLDRGVDPCEDQMLPPVCADADEVWLRRFTSSLEAVMERIERGQLPLPECTGDEMAMHLVLNEARDAVEDGRWGWGSSEGAFAALPANALDGDVDAIHTDLLEDDDVLMLFDSSLEGLEDDQATCEAMGLVNLHPNKWFLPFHP